MVRRSKFPEIDCTTIIMPNISTPATNPRTIDGIYHIFFLPPSILPSAVSATIKRTFLATGISNHIPIILYSDVRGKSKDHLALTIVTFYKKKKKIHNNLLSYIYTVYFMFLQYYITIYIYYTVSEYLQHDPLPQTY